MVRLSDIARETGLNIATVSRALRLDPRVKADTRTLVQKAADRLGYRPHWGARALAEGRSRTVWLLTPGLGTPVEREPALWAGQTLLSRGYDLLLAQHYGDPAVYGRLLDRLAHGGADGALVIPALDLGQDGAADRRALAQRLPLVYLDRRVPGVPAPWVGTDNRRAASDLLTRAWTSAREAGTPLGWVADLFLPDQNHVESSRSEGLREAARTLGLPVWAPGDTPGPPHGGNGIVAGSRFREVTGQTDRWFPGFPGTARPGWAAVFDEVAGPRSAFARVWVARQDFRALGEGAAELLLELLTRPGERQKDRLVPVRDIVTEEESERTRSEP